MGTITNVQLVSLQGAVTRGFTTVTRTLATIGTQLTELAILVGTQFASLTNLVNKGFTSLSTLVTTEFASLTSKLVNFFKSVLFDKILNTINFALNLHNALMLSRNLFESFGMLIDNVVNLIGAKLKDHEGKEVSFSEYIGTSVSEFIQNIVGEETYKGLKRKWNSLSAIYTSASNILDLTTGMLDSVQTLVEIGAQTTGKIGNALRRAGVVFEDAYEYFDEKINARLGRFKKFENFITGLEDNIDTISEIVESVEEINENLIEIKEQRKELMENWDNLKEEKKQDEAEETKNSKSPKIEDKDL